MKSKFLLPALTLFYLTGWAQLNPAITSWLINTTGEKGYDSILANVQEVQYDANYVYVSATDIPAYSIGPWPGDPNDPSDQSFTYKIPLNPVQNTGTLTVVQLGHTGVWTNGVSMFNANDGQTYSNAGVWYRNAYYFEGSSFDACDGHADMTGEYHHHVSPKCLYDETDSTHHSPIIGYMFDGFPVYGCYGFANTNGTGGIKRMNSSYQLRNITTRTTDPHGNTTSTAGPAVSGQYPLGDFLFDYEYVPGSGDLDSNNGRFCVTPEYPNGIYAYFVTIDSTLTPVYPYTNGLTYYGVVANGNTGPTGGKVTPGDSTTVYTAIGNISPRIKWQLYPNPTRGAAHIHFDLASNDGARSSLFDGEGRLLRTYYFRPGSTYIIDLSGYSAGVYLLLMQSGDEIATQKLVKTDK